MESLICPQCNHTSTTAKSFTLHVKNHHTKDIKQFCIDHYYNGFEPLCACGCGTPTNFFSIKSGFSKYVRGHISRINNAWGHNKAAQKKSQEVRRDMHSRGEIKIWNRGLKKEDDERIAEYGRKQAQNETSESLLRKSKMMKHQWKEKNIVPLYGSDHPNWKGGASHLSACIHSDARLYKEWKFPKLKAAGWKCTECASEKNLCVHHDREEMADIIHLMTKRFNYDASSSSHELKLEIIKATVDYHLQNNVSGQVLCYDCHALKHPSMNFS